VQARSGNPVAFASLFFAKIFGMVGLVLGLTNYRPLGGVLLVLDGVLLGAAVAIAVRSMRKEKREEETHKQILAQMVREGTLEQYLRDIHISAQNAL
jgi:hypothetical protein